MNCSMFLSRYWSLKIQRKKRFVGYVSKKEIESNRSLSIFCTVCTVEYTISSNLKIEPLKTVNQIVYI